MTKDLTHIHKFDTVEKKKITLRRYVKEDGKTIPDIITGFDLIKLRKCKCGKSRAFNAERKVV